MEQRNEPSTAEIVRALRGEAGILIHFTCDDAADRLESQERTIADLTARAESAERERDAAIKELEVIEQDGLCSICKFESTIPLMECMENCVFKWRGLPQEGEGK